MSGQVFRKKAIEKISNPTELDNYIQVINPSIWVICIATLLIIAGVFVWAIFGRIYSTINCVTIVNDGKNNTYVAEKDIDNVKTGMLVEINDKSFEIQDISREPYIADDKLPKIALDVIDSKIGEKIYNINPKNIEYVYYEDGIYKGLIKISSISPMQFILN